MRERFHKLFPRVASFVVIAVAGVAAACTESFDGGAACPSLCPAQQVAFRDTIIDAVALDTAIGGYPALGLSGLVLLANRPDTLETRGVIRFDVLPTQFRPNNGTDLSNITAIDSVFLKLRLDSLGRLGAGPVTLSVFDVDTLASDSVTAVVRSLFRPDRLLGSVSVTPAVTGDSLRIPLDKARILAKIVNGSRLRLGLRLSNGSGQLRLIAFRQGIGAPTVTLDESTDTTYAPISVQTSTIVPNPTTTDASLAYEVYTIIDRSSAPPAANTLAVGGIPGYRSYLRFVVPGNVLDSSTVVRADLLLTQRPSSFASASDSVRLVPLVPASSDAVTDVRRILELSVEGTFAALSATALVPRDSGQRAINVLNLVRSWGALPANVPRAVAFRVEFEGAQASQLLFFSSEAAPSLRPRLRITFLPRAERGIP